MAVKKIRVNINISEKLKEYFEVLSNETGCSQSALMCLALNDYMDGKKAMKELPQLMKIINKKELEKNE